MAPDALPVSWEARWAEGWPWVVLKPTSNRHMWATHVLRVRDVRGRGTSPSGLANNVGSAHTHSLHFFSVGRPAVSVCPRDVEFPRMQDFQAKTGTVWGKPPPEACWYFKQQSLKTEWRQTWMQLWAPLPLSAVSLTKHGVGTGLELADQAAPATHPPCLSGQLGGLLLENFLFY